MWAKKEDFKMSVLTDYQDNYSKDNNLDMSFDILTVNDISVIKCNYLEIVTSNATDCYGEYLYHEEKTGIKTSETLSEYCSLLRGG